MRIESILVGKPVPVPYRGKQTKTAIFKEPVKGPVLLRTLNLEGDEQADLRVHGGPDKALYAYGVDAYQQWKEVRPDDEFPPGAMGDNLALSTLPEDQMYIGATYRLGQAVVQVSQPRFPCFKLGIKFEDHSIIKQFMQTGRPGVYFRVLQEGEIAVGDTLELISQEKTLVSVLELFQLKKSKPTAARVKQILGLKSLPDEMREALQSLLE